MKQRSSSGLSILLVLAGAAVAAASTLTVMVEEAKVRKRGNFIAPAVATVHYGDQLEAGERRDGWIRVSADGVEGWLHQSALGSKAARVRGGKWEGNAQASADEVTLAGKGFNADVERSYQSGHPALDYAAVDAMERRAVSERNLIAFMKKGGLLPAEDR